MKRLLILALLALCLTGCGGTAPEVTLPSEAVQTEPVPTEGPGLYDQAASMALDPTGAVSCYPLAGQAASAIRLMGEDLVVFSTGETTTLTMLSGADRYVAATAQLPLSLDADAPGTQVSEKGITYYDQEARALVFLNTGLEEVNRISLPEGILGEPVLSSDRKTLYYATADSLRVIDLDTKRDRLLLETSYDALLLNALHLDDTVLECQVREGESQFRLFLRADTGEALATAGEGLSLYTSDSMYFARLEAPGYPELLTGTPGEAIYTLETGDYAPGLIPVMEGECLLTTVSEESGTRLELYDLRLGDRSASLTLAAQGEFKSTAAEPGSGALWLLFFDGQQELLLRWDPASSPVADDNVYRLPRRTAEAPDTAGLAACAETARELSEKYDVTICLWQETLALQPEDYQWEAEYRVPLLRHCLEAVDALLSAFPEGFFEALVPGGETLRLCLTGPISGREGTGLDAAAGIQFWREEVPVVAVTAGDTLTQTLAHELFHVIDSRVLSLCAAYDGWTSLNPQGFDYDYSYDHTPRETDRQWTTGDDRAFIDTYSMSFPREDRARIMEYAMMDGCEESFSSQTMQRKLRTLCRGIREAFDLEKASQTFPWEQYLTEPLI